jgi:hypothetical protein
MGEAEETISREEFIERFVKHMLSAAGATFNDGSSIEEYAREIAPTYWGEKSQREDGPESCAEGDMDCWKRA